MRKSIDKSEVFTISISVTTNLMGERHLLVDGLFYSFNALGYLRAVEDALLSENKRHYKFKPCGLISILVSCNDEYIQLASFNSENVKVDEYEMTLDKYTELTEELKQRNVWNFMDIRPEYTRFVYLIER